MRAFVKYLFIGIFVSFTFLSLAAHAQTGGDLPTIPDSKGSVDALFVDVTQILESIKREVPVLVRFIVALSYTMGVILFTAAIIKLKAYGNNTVMSSTHANLTVPFVYVIMAMAMVYFPTMIDVSSATLLGITTESLIAYPGSQGFPLTNLFASVVAIVKLVGYVAFLRGWVILSKLGSNGQHGTLSKGITHIVGGVLAVNILATWEVVRQTLGYII